jgi:hypothetical protein
MEFSNADEVERLRTENARLLQQIELLSAENVALKKLVPGDSGHPLSSHGTHEKMQDALWPIRQLLARPPAKEKEEEFSENVVAPVAVVSSPRSQRDNIIDEIIATEERYVQDMTLLTNLFRNPFLATMHDDSQEVLTKVCCCPFVCAV